jgi:hypothetical protein
MVTIDIESLDCRCSSTLERLNRIQRMERSIPPAGSRQQGRFGPSDR